MSEAMVDSANGKAKPESRLEEPICRDLRSTDGTADASTQIETVTSESSTNTVSAEDISSMDLANVPKDEEVWRGSEVLLVGNAIQSPWRNRVRGESSGEFK